MDAEVGIVGLGSMGSMALWQLSKARVSAIGFEQFGIGHDRSAAGGETRIFRTAYKEGLHYIPLLKDAYMLWRELESETGNEILQLTKGLIIGSPESTLMKNSMKSIEAYQLEHNILSKEEANIQFPQHSLLSDEQIIIDGSSGYLRPQYAIMSAVSRADELGATIFSHTLVDHITSDAEGVTIYADGTVYKVRKVIITAGPWATNFLGEFASFFEVRRLVNGWFLPKNDATLFGEKNFPVFTRESSGFSFYGLPAVDGNMVKLGLQTTEKSRIGNPNFLDRSVTINELEHFKHAINHYLPDLYNEPSRVNAYMELYTKDQHPIIGKLPYDDGVIVLTGFSGHGFKMASVMGRIAVELAIHGETNYNILPFSPNRFVNMKSR